MKMGKDALIVTKRKVKIKEFCARGCRDGGKKELEIRVNDSTMWVRGGDRVWRKKKGVPWVR